MPKLNRTDLVGGTALDWINTQGWHTTYADPTQQVRVACERLQTGMFVIGRLWHTPMTVDIQPPPASRGHVFITPPLTGTRHITLNDQVHELRAPDMLVHPGHTPFELHTDAPAAHAFLEVPRGLLQPWLWGTREVRPIECRPGYRDTVVNALMAALNGSFASDSAASATWAVGMQQLVLAMVQSSVSGSSVEHWPTLVNDARRLIRAKAHDPTYTIAKLARDLYVSTTHLHRVIRVSGKSAGQLLRSQRTELARSLFGDVKPSVADYARVAELAGFSSTRVLKRALSSPSIEDDSSSEHRMDLQRRGHHEPTGPDPDKT